MIQTVSPGDGDRQWKGEEQCRKTIDAVKSAGGKVSLIATYEQGVRGVIHMMMQVNNLQVADWIFSRVLKYVSK